LNEQELREYLEGLSQEELFLFAAEQMEELIKEVEQKAKLFEQISPHTHLVMTIYHEVKRISKPYIEQTKETVQGVRDE